MQKIKLVALFILIFISGFSQQTKITGKAPGAEGKIIELITYSDLITFREKSITKSLIDSTGKFELLIDLPKTVYGSLDIDFHKTDLFIEPGRTYNLTIAPLKYNDVTEVNPFIQSQNLDISFEIHDMNELNFLVQQFNTIYNNFLLVNFNALYRDRDKSRLDTLRYEIITSFKEVKNSYFTSYITYKIASLEQLCQALSQPQIGKTYFSTPPVLYENLQYMEFFNLYFSKYITITSKALKNKNYNVILKDPKSYDGMMKTLAEDTLLRKPQLRELVMLKGAMEMYHDTAYNQDAVLALLHQVGERSIFPDNRQIAGNMIYELTHLRQGTEAPGFNLTDRNQKKVSLKDFKGKPVLLNFWTTYCQGCIGEMDMMKPLYDKYKDKIEFVSISADKDFNKMLYYINLKTNFVWSFLHVGDSINLLKEYDVRIYPLFVLIDKEGKIYRYPADNPSASLGSEIERLVNQ